MSFGVSWILAIRIAAGGNVRDNAGLHSAKVERVSASLTDLREKAGLPASRASVP